MSYGNIKFSQWDIEFTKRTLESSLDDVLEKLTASNDDDERSFYQNSSEWLEKNISKFEAAVPGRISFSESDLSVLKALLFGVAKPQLVIAWKTAKDHGDDVVGLGNQIDKLADLEVRISKPFERDRSQDPEPEEDHSENDLKP